MTSPVRKIMFATTVGVASTLVTADVCEAGLFDWLFGRPVVVYPAQQVVAYPGVPVAAPAYAAPISTAGMAVAPVAQTTNYAPYYRTVANYPVAVAGPVLPAAVAPVAVAPVAQPVVVGYAPSYRTNWLRVPVTYYRPVTGYTVAGYPAVAATPCNTYAWQAQRVPTLVHRPWLPFVPATAAPVTYGYAPAVPAPITYGYAPVPAAVNVAPVAPAAIAPAIAPPCQACPPTGSTAAPPYYGSTPSVDAPPSGAVQNSAPLDNTAPVPASGIAPAANEAPSLLPGSFPSPLSSSTPNDSTSHSITGSTQPLSPIPAGSASAQQQSDSLYRVTPIPAPDVRTFDAQRKAPSAPPLLQGRERTVSNQFGQTTVVANTSWTSAKPSPQTKPGLPGASTAAPLWKDGGWKN